MTKIAAIQLCSSDNLNENLKITQALMETAAKNGAQLIVLPENFALMDRASHDIVKQQEIFGQGKIQKFLSDCAKDFRVWILGGTIPLRCNNPHKKFASCLVYDGQGLCVARYDKIHLFDVTLANHEKHCESDSTEPGDKVVVIPTPFGKLGLAVCYDLRFPELFRQLFNLGAEIIVLPAAFTALTGKAHWEVLT